MLTHSRHWIVASILLAAILGMAVASATNEPEQRSDRNACWVAAEAQESFAESEQTSSELIEAVPSSLRDAGIVATRHRSPRHTGIAATLGDPRTPQAARAPPHEAA